MKPWIPDKIFGKDSDDLLAYQTSKQVLIRDRYLGVFYYFLVFAVCLWVFGYQILYCNDQFLMEDVKGLPRMWATHPTRNQCNPRMPDCESDFASLEELPYCDDFKGAWGEDEMKAPCKYEDMNTVGLQKLSDNKLFIPTAVEVITERLVCHPSRKNDHTCNNEYEEYRGADCMLGTEMCRTRANRTDQYYYVADVNDFMIQFTSSYMQGAVHGTSLDHPASYGVCPSLLRKHSDGPEERLSWQDRVRYQQRNFCPANKVEIREVPCAKGIQCKRANKFDFLKHSGANDILRRGSGYLSKRKHASNQEGRSEAPPRSPAISGLLQKHASNDEGRSNEFGLRKHSGARQLMKGSGVMSASIPKRGTPQRHNPADRSEELQFDQSLLQLESASSKRHSITDSHGASWLGTRISSLRRSLASSIGMLPSLDALLDRHGAFPTPPPLGIPPGDAGRNDAAASIRTRGGSVELNNESYFPAPDQYQGPWGDNFKLGRLLDLAGSNLDADFNFDGWTSRQSGTVLEVRIVYENLWPFLSTFGYSDVKYHYEVNELPMPYMSRTFLSAVQPPDYPHTRIYEVRHGVLVWFKVSGQFGVFSWMYFLLMVVTALALISSATTLTDLIAIRLHDRKDNYFHLKYDVSPDFSDDVWKCDKCGWHNFKDNEYCKRVPAWECKHTTAACGQPRPEKAEA